MAIYVRARDGMGSGEDSVGGALQNLLGMTENEHMGTENSYIPNAGVMSMEGFDMETIQDTPAAMSVEVRAGKCLVLNSSWTANSKTNKYWEVLNTATVTCTIDANSSGSTRYDLICVKVDAAATPDDTASNVATIITVKGTAGAGVPATPSDHYKLAEITVVNGETSILTASITDRRVGALINGAQVTTWNPAGHTWTRTGNYTFTCVGDWRSRYVVGTRVKYTDATPSTDYGVVISATYTGGVTTVTLATNADYAMAAGTVTSPYFSYNDKPYGYPGWFNWTSTRAVSGGTAPSYTTREISRFRIVGTEVRYQINWRNDSGGTAGNGSNTLTFTLPVSIGTAIAGTDDLNIGYGYSYEASGTTKEVHVRAQASNTSAYMELYDMSAFIVGNDQSSSVRLVSLQGFYEI